MKRLLVFTFLTGCFFGGSNAIGQASEGKGLNYGQMDSLANKLAHSSKYLAYVNELESVNKEILSNASSINYTKHTTVEFIRVLHDRSLNPIQKNDSLKRMGLNRQIKQLEINSNDLMQEHPELSNLRKGTIGAIFYRTDKLLNPSKYNVTSKGDYDKVFTKVQQAPAFPGGAESWKKYLERNLKADAPAKDGAPAGTYTVKVQFITDTVGNVSNVKAIEVPKQCPSCAMEAVKMIARGPKWQPAVQNGRNVVFQNVQSIDFTVPAL